MEATLVPEAYDKREHALIKHKLLEAYLSRLVMIIGQGRAEKICFVDCFAGPWMTRTDDLSDSSIGIALAALEGAQRALASAFERHVRLRAMRRRSRIWHPPIGRSGFCGPTDVN